MTRDKKRWWVLGAITAANAMGYLDATILPVALPTIQSMLHSSSVQLQWMVNSYLLALSIFVAISGKLGDIYGHRKVFTLGIMIFGFFSIFCGFSQTSWQLIINRFFQGIGAAMFIPTSLALLCENFSDRHRGKAMGIVTAGGSICVSIAPVLGGFFTQYLSWHYIFFVNIPICGLALWLAFKYIVKSTKLKERIDFVGFITFLIGIFCLTLGIMQGKDWGWNSLRILLSFSLSLLSFVAFYFSCQKSKSPFFDLSLFKIRAFFCSAVTVLSAGFVRMITLFWVLFFQNILGFSPFSAGVLMLISTLPMAFITPYAGSLSDKYGPRRAILIGQGILVGTFLWLLLFMSGGNRVLLSVPLLTFGVGILLILIASYTSGISSVSGTKRGAASGLLSTLRNTGASMGVTVLGAIFANVQHSHFAWELAQNSETQALDPNIFDGFLAGVSTAVDAMKGLSASLQPQIIATIKESYIFSMNLLNGIAALIMALSLVVTYFLFRSKTKIC